MSDDNQRLEFLGELASGFAHEIKNPLSTMQLQLELLQEEFAESDSELATRNRNRIDVLLKEVRRLNDIVRQFREVTQGHDLKLIAVDMRRFLEDQVALHRPQAEQMGVSLSLQILNPLGSALIDESWFASAIANLIQNAIFACETKGDGHVWIEAGRARGALGISVIDTGVGIPESNRHRLFRAYFTTRKEGTGMGLPMARRIIEDHGGRIAFDSIAGQGSRFVVLLPIGTGDTLTQVEVAAKSSPERRGPDADMVEADIVEVSHAVNTVLAESKRESQARAEHGRDEEE